MYQCLPCRANQISLRNISLEDNVARLPVPEGPCPMTGKRQTQVHHTCTKRMAEGLQHSHRHGVAFGSMGEDPMMGNRGSSFLTNYYLVFTVVKMVLLVFILHPTLLLPGETVGYPAQPGLICPSVCHSAHP